MHFSLFQTAQYWLMKVQDPRYIVPPSDEDVARFNAAQYQLAQAYDNDSGGGSVAQGLIFWIFWLILIIAGCVWVKRDALRHQIPCFGNKFDPEKDPMVWAVICFLLCPSFLYYFYRRSNIFYDRGRDVSQEAYINSRPPTFTRPIQPKMDASHPSPPAQTLDEQLETIHRLKEKGLITLAEWEQKKRNILGL